MLEKKIGVALTMTIMTVVMMLIMIRRTDSTFAAEVDVHREALEWVREAGYSSLGVTCLIQEGLYTRCSVCVNEKEESIELRCNNLTGTCERIQ